MVPRSLLTASVASASPSTSSPITSSSFDFCSCFSSSGRMSLAEDIFWSVMKMKGSSITASIRSGLVTKYGEM